MQHVKGVKRKETGGKQKQKHKESSLPVQHNFPTLFKPQMDIYIINDKAAHATSEALNIQPCDCWCKSCDIIAAGCWQRYFHLDKAESTSWKLLPRCANSEQHAQNIIRLLVFINLCRTPGEQPECRLCSWSLLCFCDVVFFFFLLCVVFKQNSCYRYNTISGNKLLYKGLSCDFFFFLLSRLYIIVYSSCGGCPTYDSAAEVD